MSRNKNKQSFLQTRRFKYGSAAAALTVVVIALIIVVNVILHAFAANTAGTRHDRHQAL